jgi:hypothetical protein
MKPVQMCRTAGLHDQRIDVLELALHGVNRLVAAVATTTAGVVEDTERRGQLGRGWSVLRPVVERAGHEDDCRAFAYAVEGDQRPVLRSNVGHVVTPCPWAVSGGGQAAGGGVGRPARDTETRSSPSRNAGQPFAIPSRAASVSKPVWRIRTSVPPSRSSKLRSTVVRTVESP